ncbi:uncharacterized protein [Antedon mediterranea]|uniref:uncharacterized protein n=1 Tax=Antedon mediterranea TaxID=105859 RepID=UPI003AF481BA
MELNGTNNYYFFKQHVFGCRSSPKIFDTLSQAVCWIASNVYNIHNILHLLDDFLVIESPTANAQSTKIRFLDMFKTLGIPLSEKKTEGPSTSLEYLGIYLDSINMEARLPTEKIARIQNITTEFSKRASCTKRELLSLLGHLNFACRVIHPGRSFVSHLISLSTTVKKLHHHIRINKDCRADLAMWSLFLKHWNGVSFFLNDNITIANDISLYTDATRTSFGGIYRNEWFQGNFPQIYLTDKTSMAFFELYPIVMACVLWGNNWSRKRIMFFCDNMATVEIVSKGRSRIPDIMKLMRKLTYHSAIHNYHICATHIAGKHNVIADALSRHQMQKFRRLVPTANALPTPCVHHSELLMN